MVNYDEYMNDLNHFNQGIEQGREEASYDYVHPFIPFIFGLMVGVAGVLMLLGYI